MKYIFSLLVSIGLLFFLALGAFKKPAQEPSKEPAGKGDQRGQLETPIEAPLKNPPQPFPSPTIMPSEAALRKENDSNPTTETAQPTDLSEKPLSYSSKVEALYERIKNVPFDEELKRLKPIDATFGDSEERMFPYFYKGLLDRDPERRIVRLNLSFRNFGPSLDSSACFFFGSLEKFEAQTTANEGTMQILRSDDPGYIVVNISNKYFLQIFQTSERPSRRYKSIMTIQTGKENKKYSLILEGIDGAFAAGRKPTCFELTLSN